MNHWYTIIKKKISGSGFRHWTKSYAGSAGAKQALPEYQYI